MSTPNSSARSSNISSVIDWGIKSVYGKSVSKFLKFNLVSKAAKGLYLISYL